MLLECAVANHVGLSRHGSMCNCTSSILSVSQVGIFSISTRVKCSGSSKDRLETLVPPEEVHVFIVCARSKEIKGSSILRDCAGWLRDRYCNLGLSRMATKLQVQFAQFGAKLSQSRKFCKACGVVLRASVSAVSNTV